MFIWVFEGLRMFGEILQKFLVVRQVTEIQRREETLQFPKLDPRTSLRVVHFESRLFLVRAWQLFDNDGRSQTGGQQL